MVESSRLTQSFTSQNNFSTLSGAANPTGAQPASDPASELMKSMTTDGLLGIETPAQDPAAGEGAEAGGSATATANLNTAASLSGS